MIRIRLSRGGKKNDPYYRVVAVDRRKKAKGGVLDVLGYWFPRKKDVKIDMKKVELWISKGARPTKAILTLLES